MVQMYPSLGSVFTEGQEQKDEGKVVLELCTEQF